MSGLWEDIDGERWLENPQLILAGNPTRKRFKTMAKSYRRKRRGRKAAPRRRRRVRTNYAASGLIANPRRRRRSHRRRTRRAYAINPVRRRRRHVRRIRRHYRINPALMGFQLPALQDVLFTGAGIVIPPIMTSFVMGYLPADWKTSRAAYYGVKVASVLVPSMLVRKFVSRRAGNLMLVGGAASFAIDLVREFMPTLLPASSVGAQPFLGFYERMPNRTPMMAAPGMGRYASIPVRSQAVQRTPLLSITPERLSPGSRF